MNHKKLNSRCQAKTKRGKPCPAFATAGGLCFFHTNPNKAAELGRIGGRSNRPAAGENADSLPTLDNALAVRDTVARLIADVYAGRIHPRIAAGLAPLLNLQMRAIETTDFERRLARLEKLSAETAEAEGRLDRKPSGPESDLANSAKNKLLRAFGVSEAEQAANGVEKS